MQQRGMRIWSPGPMEIGLIAVIVVVLFGAGKISGVGGALGRSIREFRQEKDGLEEDSKSDTKKQVSTSEEDTVALKSGEVESGEKADG